MFIDKVKERTNSKSWLLDSLNHYTMSPSILHFSKDLLEGCLVYSSCRRRLKILSCCLLYSEHFLCVDAWSPLQPARLSSSRPALVISFLCTPGAPNGVFAIFLNVAKSVAIVAPSWSSVPVEAGDLHRASEQQDAFSVCLFLEYSPYLFLRLRYLHPHLY